MICALAKKFIAQDSGYSTMNCLDLGSASFMNCIFPALFQKLNFKFKVRCISQTVFFGEIQVCSMQKALQKLFFHLTAEIGHHQGLSANHSFPGYCTNLPSVMSFFRMPLSPKGVFVQLSALS